LTAIELFKTLGSPFEPDNRYLPSTDLVQLYETSKKNKLGFPFLERLNALGALETEELRSEYELQKKKYGELMRTGSRIAQLLKSNKVEYAIYKSIFPLPIVANDIDLILFDSRKAEGVRKILAENNYDLIGEAPLEFMVHDSRDSKHADPEKKDTYDIDFYLEIGASKIIYLDKEKFRKHLTQKTLEGVEIDLLTPEAELTAILVHSVYPEMLYTGHLYYITLNYLYTMSDAEIKDFADFVIENKVTVPVKSALSITGELHKKIYGRIPEKLEKLIKVFGSNKSENEELEKKLFKIPKQYKKKTILETLLEKIKEKKARNSILRQVAYTMNPKILLYIIRVFADRRRRETY
jgi:hypothetical protein